VNDAALLFWEASTKAALYLSLQCVVGAAAAYWLARSCGAADAAGLHAIFRRLQRTARWAASGLLLATGGRVLAHTLSAFGNIDAESVRTMALESRWGQSWQIQAAAATIVWATAAGSRRMPRAGWPIYSVSALLYCACVPMVGHGAGSLPRMGVHALHVAAGGVWIGSLAMLAILGLSRSPNDSYTVHQMVSNFSRIALPGAAILVATGAIASVLYVRHVANLWHTQYGEVLLAKLAFVAAVVALGRRNWLRSRRGQPPSLRVMVLELAAAAVAVMITGVLSELEHP
jgi:putative copper resistance protein D